MAGKTTSKATKKTVNKTFSAEEQAAMKERARELKADARAGKDRAAGEKMLLEAVAKLPAEEQALVKGLHALIGAAAPVLAPKTWYGMPAWALDGKVLCFFQPASKFRSRYGTFGFTDQARLDEGAMWPTSFGLVALGKVEQDRIRALLGKALG